MKVTFSKDTRDDFNKHRDYLRRTTKSDGHKYQKYELDGIDKSLKKHIKDNIEKKKNEKDHIDSIFPEDFEYSKNKYKMTIDKKSHHVIFYTIKKSKNGELQVSIKKCIHSTELKKELEDRDIKPLKGADKSLLSDLEQIYKEDDVKNKEEYEDEETIEKEDTDDEGNPRQHKTGPKGGKYYRVKKDGKWGPWNSLTNENTNIFKSLKLIINESKIRSLKSYLKK